jgi:hypothetical protein
MKRWQLLLGVALVLAAAPALGSTFLHMSHADLARHANAVVVGNVLSVESFWNKPGRVIVTEAMVEVEDAIAGDAPSVVVVRTFGGTVNGYTVEAHGFPTFTKGERLLLFLENDAREPGTTRVVGYQEGKYRVVVDRNGVELAVPTVDEGARLLTADGKPAPEPKTMRLADFRAEIRDLVERAERPVR